MWVIRSLIRIYVPLCLFSKVKYLSQLMYDKILLNFLNQLKIG